MILIAFVSWTRKSLDDALNSEQSQGDDDRSALETAIIRESLAVCRGRPRWVPHNLNPSDSMTKFVGGHHEPLLKLLQSGKFMIEDEDEVLSRGKQAEQRLKTSQSSWKSNFWGLMNTCQTPVHSMRT